MNKPSFSPVFFVIFLLLAACSAGRAPVFKYAMGEGAGSAGIHTVTQGETLWVISKRYGIAARDIAVFNNLSPPFYVHGGERLKMPPPQKYAVRAGDRIQDVSRLFGVASSEIAAMNDLHQPYTLRAGQSLRLPSVTEKNQPAMFAPKNIEKNITMVSAAPVAGIKTESLAPPTVLRSPAGKTAHEGKTQPAVALLAPAPSQSIPESPVTAKTPPRAGSKFLMPVGGRIISGYGPKPGGLYNDGINIQAPKNAPVRAADNGVVVYEGSALKGSGNLVLIRHADRWMTAYAHLNNILVKRGQVVHRGQAIGAVGSTGSVDSPQLHFEIRRGAEALNPQLYVAS